MACLLKMSAENSAKIYLRTADNKMIADELRSCNVSFLHDKPDSAFNEGMFQSGALAEKIKRRNPKIKDYFVESQQVKINPADTAALSAAAQDRANYYQEHTHDENEAWYIHHGQTAFYLHLQNYVYAIICTAGDFICIPGQTRHWFDAGAAPSFSGLRFYLTLNAPVTTGDKIALRYPQLECLSSLITLGSAL
ncbi:methionine salvage pathway enzyme E-2/E-2\' [Erwinia pyrifoliae]|uniref:Acireductone dioxygenase n=1 Tax=Erwinia pyrifoliae TaxID=79967 RepID=A0ABY5XAP9_ERWPY|nr:methionine salvage pathway enzyme E-2/E-2\' [Erwinia pyrifoliae]AUX73995.1 hypothetical protein CPI84_16935 [Erwinia pyrifoliae]MCA8875666.1 hypothetical protein [Erwinia pyrifoliae]MCT2385871.1 hypothetical protein [Erwinia pyrifoliae]MCU8588552.1 hypothetical protein [Erwinia pyrifoliae]UWS29709.1 hypothetical protein NYP81_17955 [Erwinia pyrifoliae]